MTKRMNNLISNKIEKISQEGIRGKKVPHKQAIAVAIHMVKDKK